MISTDPSTNKQLKARGRTVLLGHMGTAVLAVVLTFLIRTVLSEMSQWLLLDNKVLTLILTTILQFLAVIVIGLLDIGLCALFLNLHYNPEAARTRDVFTAFRENTDTSIRVRSFFSIMDVLFYLPSNVLSLWLPGNGLYDYYMPVVLLIGLGMLLHFLFSVLYGISSFLILDFPEMGPMENLRRTRQLMRGNFGRLLRLYLSFIPLYLLSGLSMGITAPWVSAYQQASMAAFYKDLME